MRELYNKLCKLEMTLALICLSVSVTVIFIAAVMRTVKMPIRWGLDIALLLFTWSTFLGADIAFRRKALVRVDMLINALSPSIQKVLEAVVYICMVSAIVFMLVFGVKLTIISKARVFQGLPGLSYSWVTLSIPVSMTLMLITAVTQGYEVFFSKKAVQNKEEPVC
ncbi:MAG: TRAP transporter small permease [Spirochaetaceae bacterium]|jgi:TRAP-type C4-dicarboxylate transport system permease small subunit|nr:TRAP transporter small permease [Spirochaetaceae bacterium]